MADRDPEKALHTPTTPAKALTTSSRDPKIEEEQHHIFSEKDSEEEVTSSASRTSSINSSHLSSRDSNPLDPLECALSHPNVANPLTAFRTNQSTATTASRLPDFEVDFQADDPENPKNWPIWYKSLTIFSMSLGTWCIVFYSTSYTSSMPGMMKEWGVRDEAVPTLGITTYLVGLAVGSLLLAPISEMYGRRPVYIVCLVLFCLLILPCALATSLSEVIVVRFFGAVAGSCMIANAPGTLSDITSDLHRALIFSIWSIGPMNGPVTGPLIGGFAYQYLGWRWTNWLVLIFTGVAWLFVSSIRETYAPAILRRKAALQRKTTGDDRYWSRYDTKSDFLGELKINLVRPLTMAIREPILWFWNLYMSVIYGILYLSFVAYPIVYSGIRGWGPGDSGLAFVGIGIGTMLAICTEPLIRKMINSHKKDPETGKVFPEANVSIVCIAAVLAPVGQLIFAWTSAPARIPWIWSLLAGIPFGAGNSLVFIYSSNYIAGAYGIYAASALAGNAVCRSFIGGTMPLAGPTMYRVMTSQWAGTFCGLFEVALIPIPYVFYKYGGRIRARSPLIREMREGQERLERKMRRGKGRGGGGDVEARGNEEVGLERVVSAVGGAAEGVVVRGDEKV